MLNEFTPVEQQTLAGLQAADGLPAILATVVLAVRGSIIAGGNALDTTSPVSIPDQVRSHVIALVRWKWLISFPKLKSMQTDERKAAAKDAEDLFQLIASQNPNRPRIESPTGASPLTAPAIKPARRFFKRHDQEGL